MRQTKANFFILLFIFLAKNLSNHVGAVEKDESITKYSPNENLPELASGEPNNTVNSASFLVQEDIQYGYDGIKNDDKHNISSSYPRSLEEITPDDIFSAVDSAISDNSSKKENGTDSSKHGYSVGKLKDLVSRLENKTDEASTVDVEHKMDEIVSKLNNASHQNLELDEDDLLDHADEDEEEEESPVKHESEVQAESEAAGKDDLSLNDSEKRKLNKKGMKKMLRCRGAGGMNGMGKCQQQMPAQIVAPQPAAVIAAPLVTALYSAPVQPTVPPAMLQTHLSAAHMY